MENSETGYCIGCKEKIPDSQKPDRMVFIQFFAGAVSMMMASEQVIEIVDEYIMKNGIYLSATQLLIFRPDVVVLAINEEMKTKFTYIMFEETMLCPLCWDAYKLLHPLK